MEEKFVDIQTDKKVNPREIIDIQRLQLLLSEQRTSLSFLRTGIAVFTLPLSVMTVLIATSKYYDVRDNLYLMIPLGIILAGLTAFAVWIVVRQMKRLIRIRNLIDRIKSRDDCLNDLF